MTSLKHAAIALMVGVSGMMVAPSVGLLETFSAAAQTGAATASVQRRPRISPDTNQVVDEALEGDSCHWSFVFQDLGRFDLVAARSRGDVGNAPPMLVGKPQADGMSFHLPRSDQFFGDVTFEEVRDEDGCLIERHWQTAIYTNVNPATGAEIRMNFNRRNDGMYAVRFIQVVENGPNEEIARYVYQRTGVHVQIPRREPERIVFPRPSETREQMPGSAGFFPSTPWVHISQRRRT
ncbi:hypothetical protein [Maricaulis sp.]|uniref:hypothetical protein n=1 Tax=Maricaulis sp. TaxID=1486257 RepID=UPI002B2747EB|nr:hypothetical protein [Maricaulis sp.]